MIDMYFPLRGYFPVTQSFSEHVARAKSKGWCTGPGNCPSKVYYYGGIDWAAPMGTPIYASIDGPVEVVREQTGYGLHVKQTNGDIKVIYGHMSEIYTETGSVVKAKTIIGRVGSTGNSTGPHIHFEIRRGGVPIDPAPYLIEGEVASTPEEVKIELVVPECPDVPIAEVICDAPLFIRTDVMGNKVGSLQPGSVVHFFEVAVGDTDTWLHIGFKQWICAKNEYGVYVRFPTE